MSTMIFFIIRKYFFAFKQSIASMMVGETKTLAYMKYILFLLYKLFSFLQSVAFIIQTLIYKTVSTLVNPKLGTIQVGQFKYSIIEY